jgi:hypothetical protein
VRESARQDGRGDILSHTPSGTFRVSQAQAHDAGPSPARFRVALSWAVRPCDSRTQTEASRRRRFESSTTGTSAGLPLKQPTCRCDECAADAGPSPAPRKVPGDSHGHLRRISRQVSNCGWFANKTPPVKAMVFWNPSAAVTTSIGTRLWMHGCCRSRRRSGRRAHRSVASSPSPFLEGRRRIKHRSVIRRHGATRPRVESFAFVTRLSLTPSTPADIEYVGFIDFP